MSYTFTPLTDEQIDAINLMEEGTYDFEVVKSQRKISKSGNAMAEIQLSVWDAAGKTHIVFDYLVFSQVNLNIKKISHFCKAVGLTEQYKKGDLPEELEGYCGKVIIGIQEPQPKGDGTFYPKKNVVIDYIIAGEKTEKSKSEEKFVDDDIPF